MTATKLRLGAVWLLAACVAVRAAGTAAGQPAASPSLSALEQSWEDLAGNREADVFRAMLALSATPRETLAFMKQRLFPVKADPQHVARLLRDLDDKDPAVAHRAEMDVEYLNVYVRGYLRQALTDRPSPELRQRLEELLRRLPYEPMDGIAGLHQRLQANPRDLVARALLIDALYQGVDYVELQRACEALFARLKQTTAEKERRELADQFVALQKLAASFRSTNYAPSSYHPSAPAGTVVAYPVGSAQPAAAEPPRSWLRAKRAIAVLEHLATPEARALLQALAEGEADALPTKEARSALERLTGPPAAGVKAARVKAAPETAPAKSPAPVPLTAQPLRRPAAPALSRINYAPEAAAALSTAPLPAPVKTPIPF